MTTTPPLPVRSRWRRTWPWLLGVLLLLTLPLAGISWWAGTEGSLSRALSMTRKLLPADQQLAFSAVTGTVSGGGHIARLEWSKPGIAVTIEDLRLQWSLRQLLNRDLRIRTLAARLVHVQLTPHPDDPEPFTMPSEVSLPLRVTVPLSVARVQIDSIDAKGVTSTQMLDDLVLHYRFDGEQHALQLTSLRYGQSHLQADGRLHARDLDLHLRVAASLRDLTPGTPLAMLARLDADGSLAGNEASKIEMQLDARQQLRESPAPDPATLLASLAAMRTTFPVPPAGTTADSAEAQVHAHAIIHPWRPQPAQEVELQVSQLNAHAFHVDAPVTALYGRASIQPVGEKPQAWDAVLDVSNDQAGAWDQSRLPLRHLESRARLSLDRIDIQTARAELGGHAAAGTLTLTGQIPLKQPTRTTLQLDLERIDLQPLMTSLPRTAFTGPMTIRPMQQDDWQMVADIRNAVAGPMDQERAPLDRLLADVRFTPAQWRIETLQMQVGTGRVQLLGNFAPPNRALELRAELQRLPLRQIHRKMANDVAAELSGKLTIDGTLQQNLAFNADLKTDTSAAASSGRRAEWEIRSIQTSGTWSPTRLAVQRIHLDAFQATADGTDIVVVLPGLDSIRAKLTAAAPGVKLDADAAMLQQSGGGKLGVQLTSAEQVSAWLRELPLIGERLPDLHARGSATLQADWQGGWRQWLAGLKNPAAHPQLRVNAAASTDGLDIEVPAIAGRAATRVDVQKLALNIQGNLAAATLTVEGDARANDARTLVDIRMRMTQARGTGGAPRWNIAVDKFAASATLPKETAPWSLQLSDNLQFSLQTTPDIELRANAGFAALSAPGPDAGEPLKVAWEPVVWRRTARGATTLQSKGAVTGMQPAWMDVLLKRNGEGPIEGAGMRTDLSLSGDWDVQMTDSVNIRAHVKRESGDLWLLEPETAAGIRTFDMQIQSAGESVNLSVNWDTERAGVIAAKVGTRLQQHSDGWSLPDDAPLSGSIQASVQNLTTWAFLAPPGWRLSGAMNADVRLAGTVQAPRLNGEITAKGLNLRSVLDGVDLHDGTLRATLDGARMQITELAFEGGTGSRAYVRGFSGNRTQPSSARGRMTVTGTIDWSAVARASEAESGIAMDLRASLERMQVLARNDRQMTLSGDLSANLKEGALRVRGDLRVDRASIVLPEASAPTLGSDVVIIRRADLKNPGAVEAKQARGQLETRKPMDMEIKLDLGNDLALQGQGITTRLEGELTVRSATYGNDPVTVFGEVRTVEGRYRAWGQALNVETGVVRFNGPYTNPSLDLLAIRPEIEVRAGVRVTGTLNAPRVQLYSDPDLPEGEKLSWVVLGRATVVAGAEGTSMQQAALGLAAGQLSGKLASGMGLDELGLGETGVTVGKRLSNELYLTYEQGLSGATSTLFIFYDITRRLTVRAQASEASAIDMIYTIKYD